MIHGSISSPLLALNLLPTARLSDHSNVALSSASAYSALLIAGDEVIDLTRTAGGNAATANGSLDPDSTVTPSPFVDAVNLAQATVTVPGLKGDEIGTVRFADCQAVMAIR